MLFFKQRKTVFALFLAAVLLGSAGRPLPVLATKETEEKIEKAKEEKEKTEKQIEQTEQSIGGLWEASNSLQGELDGLNYELAAVSERLSGLEHAIGNKQEEIVRTTQELAAAEEKEDVQYRAMKKRVQYMYEKSRTTAVDDLLEAGGFSDYLNRRDYAEQISAYDRRMLETYVETKEEIAEKKRELEEEEVSLETLRNEATAEHNRVSGLISNASWQLTQYEGQIADAEAYADYLQGELKMKSEELEALKAKLEEERRLEELSRQSKWRSLGDISFEVSDRKLLANLIYCEAGNQPYDGQVAVGAVVMNRVMSGAFPNSIVGVIYQSGQFTPAYSGRLALALARDEATDACYQAADAAMAGQTTVSNCLFFRTPIPQVSPRYVIGGHIFY